MFYILEDNKPKKVGMPELAVWFEQNNRILQQETVAGYRVSTVFLGIDHSFGDGPPLLWETMIFKGDSSSDLYCQRYSSIEEAKEGHKKAIEYARNLE